MISQRQLLFFLFALSGFCGLIYESIWSHYLKLFLGHAAYAQTLVLAIFMGGMALGAWLCSRFSARWKNLLVAYAIAEGVIGLLALIFHDGFSAFLTVAYNTWMPALGTPATVVAFKWIAATLLILPQSVLLGMTFPLMSSGIIRLFPSQPGATVATLYFSNSIGAAIGVLASGFLLIGWIGLPGTIRVAGLMNLGLAVIVWALFRAQPTAASHAAEASTPTARAPGTWRLFLLVAALTGAASFIYEIVWIRMLNLVLGSSTHAFELMLSAFILGLALGGLWIRRRIDGIAHPVRFLAVVQVIMGVLALATLFFYNQTFDLMAWLIGALPKNDSGYAQFNLASHAIAAAIMLPATFFAGMTLPLLTHTLLQQGHGEKSIGAVYASNTLGAIVGVFFATHFGMPLFGLKGLLIFGGALDIALGVLLVWHLGGTGSSPLLTRLSLAGAAALIATVLLGQMDPLKMASGVYRSGKLLQPDEANVAFHKDGKTASIDIIMRNNGYVSITTNGKPDAMLAMAPGTSASLDEPTMILAAALPLAMHPRAQNAAVIGMGSGLSTHTLLSANVLRQVDTIEIEAGIVEAAHHFRPRVELAYSSPQSHIYIDDAKTFFSTHNRKYDIILSEPSNPWVSGVAGLFSDEFYALVKNYLADDGLLVQWIQAYEISTDLIATVVKALSHQFNDYVLYASNDGDLLIVAKRSSTIAQPSFEHLPRSALYDILAGISLRSEQDVLRRRIGDKQAVDPLFSSFPLPANSDYYPVLDQNAARSRYLQDTAQELILIPGAYLPATEMLGRPSPAFTATLATDTETLARARDAESATRMRDALLEPMMDPDTVLQGFDADDARFVKKYFLQCAPTPDDRWLFRLFSVARAINPHLGRQELDRIWGNMENAACFSRHPSAQQDWVRMLHAVALRDAPAMAQRATPLLATALATNDARAEYLLLAAMLGHTVNNQRDLARQLWEQHARTIYSKKKPPLLARLIVAHAYRDTAFAAQLPLFD